MLRLATLSLCVYWLALFLGTHLPSSAMPSFEWSDKLLHIGAFSGLTFLLCWAIPNEIGRRVSNVAVAASLASIYGCVDELTQKFIPGRHCDIWDLAADVLGVALGCGCYLVAKRILNLWRSTRISVRVPTSSDLHLSAQEVR